MNDLACLGETGDWRLEDGVRACVLELSGRAAGRNVRTLSCLRSLATKTGDDL